MVEGDEEVEEEGWKGRLPFSADKVVFITIFFTSGLPTSTYIIMNTFSVFLYSIPMKKLEQE